jgi:hypothetical protein
MTITTWLYELLSHVVTNDIYDLKCSHICHHKTTFFSSVVITNLAFF